MTRSTEPLEFACPHCQSRIQAAPELAGQRIQCSQCQKRLKVPGVASRPASGQASDYAFRQVKQKAKAAHDPEQLRETPLLSDLPDTDDARPQPSAANPPSPAVPARTQSPAPASSGSRTKEEDDANEFELSLPEPGGEKESELPFGLSDLGASVDLFEGLPDRPTRTRAQREEEAKREEAARRAAEPPDPNEMFAVRCPVCDSVLMARYRQIGSHLRCSDCHTDIKVVPPAEARQRRGIAPPKLAGEEKRAVDDALSPLAADPLALEASPSIEHDEYQLEEETSTTPAVPPPPNSTPDSLDQDVDAYFADEAQDDDLGTAKEDDYALEPLDGDQGEPHDALAEDLTSYEFEAAKSSELRSTRASEPEDEYVLGDEPTWGTTPSSPSPSSPAPLAEPAAATGPLPSGGKAGTGDTTSAWSKPASQTDLRPSEYGGEGRTIHQGEDLLPEANEYRPDLNELSLPILLREVRAVLITPSVLLAMFFVALTSFVVASSLTWFERAAVALIEGDGTLVEERITVIIWLLSMLLSAIVGGILAVQLCVFGARIIQATVGREKTPDITSEFGPFEVLSDAIFFVAPFFVASLPALAFAGGLYLITQSVLVFRIATLAALIAFPPLILSVLKNERVYHIVDADLFRSFGTQTSSWRALLSVIGMVIVALSVAIALHGFRSYSLNIVIAPLMAVSLFVYFASIGITAHVVGNQLLKQNS